jgi:hypothetical protein
VLTVDERRTNSSRCQEIALSDLFAPVSAEAWACSAYNHQSLLTVLSSATIICTDSRRSDHTQPTHTITLLTTREQMMQDTADYTSEDEL